MYNLSAMANLLKDMHDKAEVIQGKRLVGLLISIFVVFLILGASINYFTQEVLNNNEIKEQAKDKKDTRITEETFEEGIITYIDPQFYPQDKISYYLADNAGKEIILLKAKDQKLEVAEGLFVKVFGKKTKTADGTRDVLLVERVALRGE